MGCKNEKNYYININHCSNYLCGIIILKDLNNKNITQPSGISLENLNQVEGVSLADAEYDRATKSIVFTLKNNTDKKRRNRHNNLVKKHRDSVRYAVGETRPEYTDRNRHYKHHRKGHTAKCGGNGDFA